MDNENVFDTQADEDCYDDNFIPDYSDDDLVAAGYPIDG
jgi:hypothetical protein